MSAPARNQLDGRACDPLCHGCNAPYKGGRIGYCWPCYDAIIDEPRFEAEPEMEVDDE